MKNLLRTRIFLKPYTWQILATLLMLFIMTALNLLVPRIIQTAVDDGLTRRDMRQITQSALLLLGLGLGSAFLSLVNRYTTEWIAAHVGYDLRNRTFDHIQHMTFTYHDHTQSGQLISRCIEDVLSIEKFSGTAVSDPVKFVILAVVVIYSMFA